MRHLIALSIALAVLLPGGCAMDTDGTSGRVQEMLGRQAVRVLSTADKVDVFRVRNKYDEVRPIDVQNAEAATRPALGMIDIYPITARGTPLGTEFARRLGKALLADGTYRWDGGYSACVFNPGVAFRIYSGSDWSEVLICFNCGQMLILTPQSEGRPTAATRDFADRAALVALAKEAFPNDPEIQRLSVEP